MPGWILLFAFFTAGTCVAGVRAGAGLNPYWMASVLFGLLLVACLLSRTLRGQD